MLNKTLVSLLERFDSKISSLEDSKNLTKISINELVSALLAQEQRRALKCEDASENAWLQKPKA